MFSAYLLLESTRRRLRPCPPCALHVDTFFFLKKIAESDNRDVGEPTSFRRSLRIDVHNPVYPRCFLRTAQPWKVRDTLSLQALGHCAWCRSFSRSCSQPYWTRYPTGGGDSPRTELRGAPPQGCRNAAISSAVVPGEEWLSRASARRREPQTACLRRDIAHVSEDVF